MLDPEGPDPEGAACGGACRLNGAIYEIDAQNTRPKSEEGSLVLLLLYHGQDDPHNFKLEEFHWCIRTAGVFEAL